MPAVTFNETLTRQQARIGLSTRRIKNLPRILVLKHQGRDPLAIVDRMGHTNATWADTHAASTDLAAELHVTLQGACYQPDVFQVSPAEYATRAALNKLQCHDSDKRARAAAGSLLTIPSSYRAGADGIAAPLAQEAEAAHTIVDRIFD